MRSFVRKVLLSLSLLLLPLAWPLASLAKSNFGEQVAMRHSAHSDLFVSGVRLSFVDVGIEGDDTIWAIVRNNGDGPSGAGIAWQLWHCDPGEGLHQGALIQEGTLPRIDPEREKRIAVQDVLQAGEYQFRLLHPTEEQPNNSLWSRSLLLLGESGAQSITEMLTPVVEEEKAEEEQAPVSEVVTESLPVDTEAKSHVSLLPFLGAETISLTAAQITSSLRLTQALPARFEKGSEEFVTVTDSTSVGSLGDGGPLTLQGFNPSAAVYYQMGRGELMQGQLSVFFEHSTTLLDDSTLTVKVNGTPVASVLLTPENAAGGHLLASVPAEAVSDNTIELAFAGHMRTSDDICAVLDDESSWLTIAAESRFDIVMQQPFFQPSLAEFPYPFVREVSVKEQAALLALPDNLSPEEIAAVLPLAGYLGEQAAWRDFSLYAVRESELTDALRADYDIIFVGRGEQLEVLSDQSLALPLSYQEGVFRTERGETISADTAVIMESSSPWNPLRGILLITGESVTALRQGIQAVINPEFATRAGGDYALVEGELPAHYTDWSLPSGTLTLDDLGYDELVMTGVGQQRRDVEIYIPADRRIEQAQIRVFFGHSPFVWHEHSFLNVYVNDNPVKGVYLDEGNEQNGLMESEIPGSYFIPGKNTLRFLFELDLENWDCEDLENARAWGIVRSGTVLEFTTGEQRNTTALSDFPLGYADNALLVIPQTVGLETTSALVLLMNQLGREIEEHVRTMEVVLAAEVDETMLSGRPVILVGDLSNNALVQQVDDQLPQSLASLSSMVHGRRRVGLVQQITSPWDSGHPLLVIAGSEDQELANALSLLYEPEKRRLLEESVASVDESGHVATMSSANRPTPQAGKATGTVATPHWVRVVGLIILIVIVCFAGVALLLRILKRKKDDLV